MKFEAPWVAIADCPEAERSAQRLVDEAQREIGMGHPLEAIALREDHDHVLFLIKDTPQVALVHLAYARYPEPLPWPSTTIFASLEAFQAQMLSDSAEWRGEV
jgi:hypothetical protein